MTCGFARPATSSIRAWAYSKLSMGPRLRFMRGRGGPLTAFARNVRALIDVQPSDLGPSDITARLGSPWIPASDVVAFVHETMGADIRIFHMPELASWTVEARQLGWLAAGTSE